MTYEAFLGVAWALQWPDPARTNLLFVAEQWTQSSFPKRIFVFISERKCGCDAGRGAEPHSNIDSFYMILFNGEIIVLNDIYRIFNCIKLFRLF